MKDVEESPTDIEVQDSELNLKLLELNLKKKELEIQEKSLTLNHNLEKFKVLTTGVAVTLITSIISWQLQNQKVEIERLSSEQQYIAGFAEQALQADLRNRYAFADYLSTIAHSKSSRARWTAYKDRVQSAIRLEESKKADIDELRDQIAELSLDPAKNKEEIESLERLISEKERELQSFQESQTVSAPTPEFTFAYDVNSPIAEEARFLWKDAIVSSTGNTSTPSSQAIVDNIIKMALALKEIEDVVVGKPVTIHSWFRSPEHNARIGGASRSRHLLGDAVVISVEGMSSQELYEKLDPWWNDRGGLAAYTTYDGVHIDGRGVRVRWQY